MIELQSRAIKVALMPQGDINTQMSRGVGEIQKIFVRNLIYFSGIKSTAKFRMPQKLAL